MSLMCNKECRSTFFDTLFHFRVIHYFVRLADDSILFAKSIENIRDLLYFQKEIDVMKSSSIEDCAKDGGEEFFTEMHCVL